jgi:hypothetical protein
MTVAATPIGENYVWAQRVIARCDVSRVLGLCEEVFGFVTLVTAGFVVGIWDLASAARWDAWLDTSVLEFRPEPVTVS